MSGRPVTSHPGRRGVPRSVSVMLASIVLAAIVLDSLAHDEGSPGVRDK
jgi:hypothetical protein